MKDLASAFVKVLGNERAAKQVYNISGERYVTFDGIAKACAIAMDAPEPQLVHFNAKDFDFGKKKVPPIPHPPPQVQDSVNELYALRLPPAAWMCPPSRGLYCLN